MKTQPTLNSVNFKVIKCPMCEKYPKRYRRNQTPKIEFSGFRWIIEIKILEIQGYCENCYKEYRIRISYDGKTQIKIRDPKSKKEMDIENYLRRHS